MAWKRSGSEIIVGDSPADQNQSKIVGLPGGGFVVTWTDYGDTPDDPGLGIRAQIYAADGSPVGSAFRVNTATADTQFDSDVALLADGRFVVTWVDRSESPDDPHWAAVRGQIFNADGSRSGGEFLVNTTTDFNQYDCEVAVLDNGSFVVTWASESWNPNLAEDIYAQLFAADGSRIGGEFLVNTDTFASQGAATIAALSDGRFLVTWSGGGLAHGDVSGGICGQFFAADGTRIGSEFLINTNVLDFQLRSTATELVDGRIVVTWSDPSEPSYQNYLDIRGQLFDANGSKIGSPFLINTTTAFEQRYSQVVALPDGRFMVVWEDASASGDDTSGWAVRGQMFAADGSRSGTEFVVATSTAGDQHEASIAVLADGRVAVGWTNEAFMGGSGDASIRVQIFNPYEYDGSNADEIVTGGSFADVLRGGGGVDRLSGEAGDDTLYGGSSNDTLIGGAGNDNLNGEDDSDSLIGGAGADTLNGGNGDDYLYIDRFDTTINAGSGYDAIFIQDNANFTLDVGAAQVEWVYGWVGDNVLDASGAAIGVTMVGEAGADQLTGSAFNDYLYVDNFDTINAGAGYDALFVYVGNGQSVTDTTINVAAANAEWVLGGAGNDTFSNAGRNVSVTLSGGDGNDRLTGGLANDYLYGNAGADTFVVTSNTQFDAILDFANGQDLINVQALGLDSTSLQAIINSAFDNGAGSTILNFGGGNQLFLYNVAKAQIDTGDFIV